MRAVIGIGNPGRNYIGTRHNVGFYILDSFAHKNKLDFLPTKSDFWKAESVIDTFRFLLIKPTTYVNNSGLVINELIDNFNLTMNDLLVIYDDVNLDTGNIRIRKTGSDGGHNGIKSIIYHLQSDSFPRIRVGVGKQKDDESLANYVLSKFNKDEINLIDQKIPLLQQLMIEFIANGYEKMLDYFSKESNTNSSNLS
ncbi:MAG: aminoacyl-tRNA hydrolase [Ignavibacteriae bacterium]|nr:aminoacyl-tRNA hydrolase [Ignavibacteriota bacterium]MCB0751000.1 aminoacyl-tRNA hydrolase [Ignavibacteriota bacterium]MCB9249045.1 aminoacyl-tRNA hydrolase [Ignavibacteriales bacterium]